MKKGYGLTESEKRRDSEKLDGLEAFFNGSKI